MAKNDKACNWVRSQVSKLVLDDLVEQGMLPAQEVIGWRAPGAEETPQPDREEIIVFTNHLHRGFAPPGPKFF